MAGLDDAIAKGETALNNLYALQTAAMKKGDVVTQKALEDDIDDFTYKLTQLQSLAITADDAQIATLNGPLDAVTRSAQSALADLSKLVNVLNNIVTAAKVLDGIIQTAAKA